MIIDNTLVLSDHQAITASAASTNVWDTLAQGTPARWISAYGRDLGDGYMEIPLLVKVTEVFATLTSLTVDVQTDDTAAFSSATTVATSGAIGVASLTAGKEITILARVPRGVSEQYVRLYYTVAGSNATTGKVFAAVTAGNQTNTH
jgi:hypothetical protein